MRNLSASAYLLDVVDLHEKDRIVTFLSAEHGKRRGVARGAKTKFSRFGGQLQTLSRVRIAWHEKENRDLVRISDVALEQAPVKLFRKLEGILLGSYLAEQMAEFALENEESGPLFRLLDSCLGALEAGSDPGLVARYYEAWVLRLTGIFPVPRECPFCGGAIGDEAVLLIRDSALVCKVCGSSYLEAGEQSGAIRVGSETLDFLRQSGRRNVASMAELGISASVLGQVEKLCATVRRHFLQKELKSYRVMRQTLAGLTGT